MKENVGRTDRFIRIILGIGCGYLAFIDTSLVSSDPLRWFLGLFSAINIFTALFSFCPLYMMANINTRKE